MPKQSKRHRGPMTEAEKKARAEKKRRKACVDDPGTQLAPVTRLPLLDQAPGAKK